MEQNHRVERYALYAKFKHLVEFVKGNSDWETAFQTGNKEMIDPLVEEWFTPAEIEALKADGQAFAYPPEHNPVGYWLW
jgi:hypothetical protein